MVFAGNTIAFLAASLVVFIVVHQTAAAGAKSQLNNFDVVGTVKGKTFYTPKQNTKTNWFDGENLCKDSGLKLATFKTEEEFQFVRKNVPDNNDKLWIAARLKGQDDYTVRRAFEWLDGSEINIQSFHQDSKHYLCVIFSKDDLLYTDFCLSGRYKPLCQNASAK